MIFTAISWIAALALLALAAAAFYRLVKRKNYGNRGVWILPVLTLAFAVAAFTILGVLPAIAGWALTGILVATLVALPWREGMGVRYALDRARNDSLHLREDFRAFGGWLRRRWQELRMDDSSDLEPAPPAAPIQFSPNGADSMPRNTQGNGTRPPANGAVQRPAIRARRIAAQAGTVPVPAEWAAVVAGTADFEAESNVELAQWMTAQVLGLAAFAEAIVEQHETNRGMGVDPAAISMLHDVADAGVACAGAMAGAVSQFCNYFELPDAFVDAGGQLAHSGDWHQGSPG